MKKLASINTLFAPLSNIYINNLQINLVPPPKKNGVKRAKCKSNDLDRFRKENKCKLNT